MNRKLICAMFAALLFLGGVQLAHAEIWDAYADYNTTGTQTATDVWQYLTAASGGTNGPYTAMPTYSSSDYMGSWYEIWRANEDYTAYFAKITGGPYGQTDLRADHGDPALNSVLAWRSPIDGVVDLSFQVRKQIDGGTGANYYLFQDGNATPLSSGSITGGGEGSSTGLVTLPNLAVSQGTTFYLQMDPAGDPNTDTLGVSMTVTAVPEPGTLVLLCGGFAGFMVFLRRNRK